MAFNLGEPPATTWLRQQRNIRRVSEDEEDDLPPNVTRFVPRDPVKPKKPEEQAINPLPPVNVPGMPKSSEAIEQLGQSISRLGPALRNLREMIRTGQLGSSPTNVRSLDVERSKRSPENITRRTQNQIDAAVRWQKMQRRLDEISGKNRPPEGPLRWNDQSDITPPTPEAPPEQAGPDQPAEWGKNQYTMEPNLGSWWVLHSPTNSNSWRVVGEHPSAGNAWLHLQTLLNPGPRPVQ